MYKSKSFSYTYEEVDEEEKSVETMVADIMADPEFSELEEIIIGNWGEAWEMSAQTIIDDIVANKDKFSHIKSLFIGDMDYEECEVSWIIQGNYSELWAAMPQLERLIIRGSTELELGTIEHANLQVLKIICGGLPANVIEQIQKAKLPELKQLLLYIGSEGYGFDGDIATIQALVEQSDFPKLEYLGIADSEIQDEITEVVLKSKYMSQIRVLDLSMGTLTDKGGQLLLDTIGNYPNVEMLDLHRHYLSDEMMKKLQELSIAVDLEEQETPDEYRGEVYYYAGLTE